MGTVEVEEHHFKAIDKTTYSSLYAKVGDKYNSNIPDLPSTQFVIPLVADEDGIFKYIMKV